MYYTTAYIVYQQYCKAHDSGALAQIMNSDADQRLPRWLFAAPVRVDEAAAPIVRITLSQHESDVEVNTCTKIHRI